MCLVRAVVEVVHFVDDFVELTWLLFVVIITIIVRFVALTGFLIAFPVFLIILTVIIKVVTEFDAGLEAGFEGGDSALEDWETLFGWLLDYFVGAGSGSSAGD
jgi:hypothetical protein